MNAPRRTARVISIDRTRRGRRSAATQHEPSSSAASAGLHYVTDSTPGIARQRAGKGFRYVSASGTPVREARELDRIRSLAIPPAWRDVWICPNPLGHLQATGRDARGRKQHRYHPRWRQVRDEAKYGRMIEFATALPTVRAQTAADIAAPGLHRRKVLAAVVQLLEKTAIRVGNDEYARDNQSFGLTTMRDGHAQISGSRIRFRFKGKSGKFHDIEFSDRRLAKIVRKCQELPGRELFQYLDDEGNVQDVGSGDVNEYLREITGREFTAKDFRTWTGTVLAARALHMLREFSSAAQANRNVLRAIEAVAGILGNTRSVCRKCYVHPAILEAYVDGSLAHALSAKRRRAVTAGPYGLNETEAAVLALLQTRRRRDAHRKSA
jgi:DNA topoisomerase I